MQKYYSIFTVSFKPKKERLLLLIPENTSDGVFCVCKTKIPTGHREIFNIFRLIIILKSKWVAAKIV